MHQLIPTILQAPSGELALFARGRQHNGALQWDVARPCPEGWMALGSIHQTPDGYRARGPFELRALGTVTDAAEALAAIAADWDAEHDHPTMFTIPAEDAGPGGRIYRALA